MPDETDPSRRTEELAKRLLEELDRPEDDPELVKARAVTALCKSGPERERELGRFDADVEHINEAIAARCS